ncbi:MAG: hypothetical protein KKA65_04965 [Nanoarchaeota archaeon]|nr:hypothetical protein [Nanoarchaeota archaeon]MCG2719584.1 hypothetical protein [Nanoarchaeota archaeon]
MSKKDKNLEKKVEQETKNNFVEGLKALPPIAACSAGAYILNFSGCIDSIAEHLPNGLNVGYHIAAGSGIYGGYTNNNAKKIATGCTALAAMIPESLMFAAAGDMDNAGLSAGLKILSYGLGYILGYFFNEVT